MKKARWWWRKEQLNCRQVGMLLQSYLDGETEPGAHEAVAKHLDACRDCGLEAGFYERIKVALAEPEEGELDPATVERLRQFSLDLTDSE